MSEKSDIKIDRYETRLARDHSIHYYAIAGKKEIEMPAAYSEMYDENHLMIRERFLVRPEVYGHEPSEEPVKEYVPLYTGQM